MTGFYRIVYLLTSLFYSSIGTNVKMYKADNKAYVLDHSNANEFCP